MTSTPRRLSAVVVLLAAAGCTGGQLPLSGLQKVPGATTAYPGATEYRRTESEASANVMAKNPASMVVAACAPVSTAQVEQWFDARLRGAGWTRDPGDTSMTAPSSEFEQRGASWSRGERNFQLRFLTQSYADRLAAETGGPTGCAGPYETVVD
jgi:hypothetical protein